MAQDDEQIDPLDSEEDATPAKRFAFVGEPWDRQVGEGAGAFAAFTTYRDAGGKRSLAKAGRAVGKSTTQMERWSTRWQWVRRVEEWDREQDRIYQADLREQRRAMAKRHASQAVALQTAAVAAMKAVFGERFELINAETMKAGDLLKYFIESAKLERTALGEPETITETQHTGGSPDNDRKPFVPLTHAGRIDDALALLEAARARAADGAVGATD